MGSGSSSKQKGSKTNSQEVTQVGAQNNSPENAKYSTKHEPTQTQSDCEQGTEKYVADKPDSQRQFSSGVVHAGETIITMPNSDCTNGSTSQQRKDKRSSKAVKNDAQKDLSDPQKCAPESSRSKLATSHKATNLDNHKEAVNNTDSDKKVKKEIEDSIRNLKNKYQDKELQLHSFGIQAKMIEKHLKHSQTHPSPSSNHEERLSHLSNLRHEKTKLLHRLSELASSRLRRNNPDIADLSDENRPTKLAERLSELYDNEWTDVFEAITNKNKNKPDDRQIAEQLKEILKFCSEQCEAIIRKQTERCLKLINKDANVNVPSQQIQRLRDLQKKTATHSLPRVKEDVSKKCGKQFNIEKPNNGVYGRYINLCSEISWYMNIQTPPIVFDFNESSQVLARFRPYTVSGTKLDFIIWPALLLHADGPILAKGVAQFKKTDGGNGKATEPDDNNKTLKKSNTSITAPSDWD